MRVGGGRYHNYTGYAKGISIYNTFILQSPRNTEKNKNEPHTLDCHSKNAEFQATQEQYQSKFCVHQLPRLLTAQVVSAKSHGNFIHFRTKYHHTQNNFCIAYPNIHLENLLKMSIKKHIHKNNLFTGNLRESFG